MWRRTLSVCLLFFCLAAPVWADTVCHFINVGQGDAIWLALDGGYDILVDGGKASVGPVVASYLQSHGCDRVELLVATHPDADHIGGLPAVLGSIPVTEAWLDLGDCATAACADLRAALLAQGVVTSTVQMGDTFFWGDVTLAVLNPSDPPFADRNNGSIVLRVSHGAVDILLAGDAEAEAEARLIASGLPLDAEILKVGHHGSNSSSTAAFLAAVTPQVAVISVGPNPYGHPPRSAPAPGRRWRIHLPHRHLGPYRRLHRRAELRRLASPDARPLLSSRCQLAPRPT